MFESLKEHFSNNSRTKVIILHDVDGRYIDKGDKEYIINKYGDMRYSHGYTESYDTVSIWVW